MDAVTMDTLGKVSQQTQDLVFQTHLSPSVPTPGLPGSRLEATIAGWQKPKLCPKQESPSPGQASTKNRTWSTIPLLITEVPLAERDEEVLGPAPQGGCGGKLSYLWGSHGEGDCGQGLQEFRRPPGWVLGVGAVHQAQEVQHAGRECPLPSVFLTPC